MRKWGKRTFRLLLILLILVLAGIGGVYDLIHRSDSLISVALEADLLFRTVFYQPDPDEAARRMLEALSPDMQAELEAFAQGVNTFSVRGQEPVEKELRFTRHGPVITELAPSLPETAALQWVGSRQETMYSRLEGFRSLNRASN